VPIDQYLAQDLSLIRGRPFTRIEAMFSYTLDQDKGVTGTIAGYAMQWAWSRNKVRRFVNCIRTDRGHVRDSKRTHGGHPIHFIDKALMGKKDRSGTDRGQIEDRCKDTTIHPNPNPNPKKKKTKAKKAFTPPTEDEVINYFYANGYTLESAQKAFMYYDSNNWVDSRGNKIKSWKQKMIGVWFKDENKIEPKNNNEPSGKINNSPSISAIESEMVLYQKYLNYETHDLKKLVDQNDAAAFKVLRERGEYL
jgi:hypothetical protein